MVDAIPNSRDGILRAAFVAVLLAAAALVALILLAKPAHAQAAPSGAAATALADAQGGDGGDARGGEGGRGGEGILPDCSSNSTDADAGDVACPAGGIGGEGGKGGVSEGGKGGIAFTVGLQTPTTPTTQGADLAITKSGPAGPITGCAFLAPVPGGCTVNYTVTVTNLGNQTANGVTVNDSPVVTPNLAGQGFFTQVNATPSQGTCNAPGNVVGNPTNVPFSCNLGSLAPGSSATIAVSTRTLVALVSPTAVQTNQASVTSTTADTNPGNNVSPTVTTNLQAA